MERKTITLTERQVERMDRLSAATGLSFSELTRRAIDRLLDEEEPKHGGAESPESN